jgi:hypothetical protein
MAVVLAAAYHGSNWYRRHEANAHRPGLPEGMTDTGGPATGPRVVYPRTTDQVVDADEVTRFKAAEEAKGNTVIDTGVGPLIVSPGRQGTSAPAGAK